MARIIEGRITNASTGAPIADALVKAWDEDGPSDNDIMGESRTGPDGRYQITYKRGDWPPPVPTARFTRPDIYIRVFVKDAFGTWKSLYVSKTHKNQRRSANLNINAAVTPHPYEGIVYGTISQLDGTPAAGMTVYVFEDLFPESPVDRGNKVTDANGDYMIRVGNWDDGDDIFIVARRTNDGIVEEFRSHIADATQKSDGLRIDLEIPPST